MKHCNNFRRMFRAAAFAAAACMLLASCTKVDDTLGGNLIPDNQQMKVGFVSLGGKLTNKEELNPKKYFETRLFQTDSIIASNLSYGYMGEMLSDTFGLRRVGFLSQYISYYKVDSGYFGYRPIFDSAQLSISISSFGGDTLVPLKFRIYEVVDNSYITEKQPAAGKTERDSIFYTNFDATKYVGDKVLFTFTFPDGTKTGPKTSAVTLRPTDDGREFIQRLMLQKGKYAGDYSIYSTDSLEQWVGEFKGLYIVPEPDQIRSTDKRGGIYATKLDATGLSVYGRNRLESDPSLIKDTIGMVYYFYDSYATHGNLSINTVEHDWDRATSAAKFDIAEAREPQPGAQDTRPLNPRIYVEGMGGVVTELTFTEEFFKELEAVRERESIESDREFTSMAFSQARMMVYFPGSDYDWSKIDPSSSQAMIDQMNTSISRLGLYTDYKKLSAIADYAYTYEKNYQTELAYGGYISRSRGCYTMDITAYLQSLWNSYLEQKKAAGIDPAIPGSQIDWSRIDWSKIENRRVYIAPEAYSLFTPSYGMLQGMNTHDGQTAGLNNAPIKIDLTYNMIK